MTVLRGLLQFLAYILAFWFIYRVIVRALRYITRDAQKNDEPGTQPPREGKTDVQINYLDVKDARFKDLPDDSSKPS
ncbi:MAG: hypothetical protein Q8P51_05740 [Ignavibacteria bacterium]|nr:hypothetical protein [Ignavibacteria bacterium]